MKTRVCFICLICVILGVSSSFAMEQETPVLSGISCKSQEDNCPICFLETIAPCTDVVTCGCCGKRIYSKLMAHVLETNNDCPCCQDGKLRSEFARFFTVEARNSDYIINYNKYLDYLLWHLLEETGSARIKRPVVVRNLCTAIEECRAHGVAFPQEILEKIICAGDIKFCDSDGRTALWHAAHVGCTRAVKWLLAHDANPNVFEKTTGSTVWLEAIARRDEEMLEALVWSRDEKININQTRKNQVNALYRAVFDGWFEGTEILFKHGVKCTRDERIENPLFLAVQKGFHDIVNLLLENKSRLFEKELVEHWRLCMETFVRGVTPLFIAAQKGDERMVEILLNAGADPLTKRVSDQCPAWSAAWSSGHTEVARMIACTYADKKGGPSKAFMDAVKANNVFVAHMLCACGLMTEAEINRGLFIARKDGFCELAKLFIDYGGSKLHSRASTSGASTSTDRSEKTAVLSSSANSVFTSIPLSNDVLEHILHQHIGSSVDQIGTYTTLRRVCKHWNSILNESKTRIFSFSLHLKSLEDFTKALESPQKHLVGEIIVDGSTSKEWINDTVIDQIVKNFPLLEKLDFVKCSSLFKEAYHPIFGSGGPATSKNFAIVAELKNLKRLTLVQTGIQDEALCAILTGCNQLEILDLSFCYDLTSPSLSLLVQLRNLKELGLRGIQGLVDADLTAITQKCNQLERLFLHNCFKLTPAALSTIASLKNLKSLRLGSVAIDDQGLLEISKECQQLEEFELWGGGFCSSEGLLSIGRLKNLKGIILTPDSFDDRLLPMTDELIRAIAEGCPNLKFLDISASSEYPSFGTLWALKTNCRHFKTLYLPHGW